jgi:hypothetical protein
VCARVQKSLNIEGGGGGGGEGEGRGKHIELPRFMHHECGRESPPPPPPSTPVGAGWGEKTNVKCCRDVGISSDHYATRTSVNSDLGTYFKDKQSAVLFRLNHNVNYVCVAVSVRSVTFW